MNVNSNVPGIVTGTDVAAGNVEFCASNYGQNNDYGVPGANNGTFDFGDGGAGTNAGHGSMQIHNYDAKQTIIGFSDWGGANSGENVEVGIGTNDGSLGFGGNPDWTFANTGAYWTVKNLQVVVGTPGSGSSSGVGTLPAGTAVNISNNGILDLNGSTTTIGSLSGDAGTIVTLGAGTLIVNSTADSKFSGGITGTADLIKSGPNALELAGPSDYSGGTTINQGTLAAANTSGSATGSGSVTLNGGALTSRSVGSISGAVAAGSGAHVVAPGGLSSVGTLSLTNAGTALSLNGFSTLDFDILGAAADLLSITGQLGIADGTPTIVLHAGGTLVGDYTLATYSTSSSINNSSFNLPAAPGNYRWLIDSTSIKLTASSLPFGSGAWSRGGSDWLWTNSANWMTGLPNAAGHVATFGGNDLGTVDLNGDKTIGRILLDASSGGYTLGLTNTVNTLTMDNGTSNAEIKAASGAHTRSTLKYPGRPRRLWT